MVKESMRRDFFHTGGALEADYKYYIERKADSDAYETIIQGKFINLIAPRQTGKTSLFKRLLLNLRSSGWQCCFVDLATLKGLEQAAWFNHLGQTLAQELNCKSIRIQNQLDFKSFLLNQLKSIQKEPKIAILFDEIEGLSDYSFSDGFLMVLRDLYNQRDTYSGQILVAFAGANDTETLVKDPSISPFNVAENITLNDFTLEDTQKLAQNLANLEIPLDNAVNSYIYTWTSGQPHLTQRICEILERWCNTSEISAITKAEVDRVVKDHILSPQNLDTNVKHVINEIRRLKEPAVDLWNCLLSYENVSAYEPGFIALYLTGAVNETKNESIIIRNRIYEQAFQSAFNILLNKESIKMSNFKNSYALVIGIANYPKVRKLPNTILKDAQDINDLLLSPMYCGYYQANTQLLLDKKATAEGIRDGLRWLAESAGPNDTVFLYFTGHGGRVENGLEQGNYLIPYDGDSKNLGLTAISGEELTDLLRNIKSQRFLSLFDCCYSGGTGDVKGLASGLEFKSGFKDDYYNLLTQGAGRVIMASSRDDEVSLILSGMENSLFTHYLLEALQGKAETKGDNLIRVFNVFDYISEKVPNQASQHPIFKASDLENNFPIALYMGGKQVGASAPSPTNVNKSVLRDSIVKHFSLEELEIICADIEQTMADDGLKLQVDLEIVGGVGKATKVLKLIEYLDRKGFLPYLVNAIRRAHPGII